MLLMAECSQIRYAFEAKWYFLRSFKKKITILIRGKYRDAKVAKQKKNYLKKTFRKRSLCIKETDFILLNMNVDHFFEQKQLNSRRKFLSVLNTNKNNKIHKHRHTLTKVEAAIWRCTLAGGKKYSKNHTHTIKIQW